MKIAFVGKGGSGKSTITSLFSQFLVIAKNKTVCVVDADINLNIHNQFGIEIKKQKFLSNYKNSYKILKYLLGKNKKIKDPKNFIKSTPPGRGSNFFEIDENNFLIKKYSYKIRNNFFLLNIGTYDENGIGTSCFHTNLAIFENILSHYRQKKDRYLISDMVAGTDSFSNTLHLQFNVIFYIIEPMIESISVLKNFLKLAKKSKIRKKIYIIANKIENEDDLNFIRSKNLKPDIIFPYLRKIKKINQEKNILSFDYLKNEVLSTFNQIVNKLNEIVINPDEDLKKLHQIHLKICQLDYIKKRGDFQDQIDRKFKFTKIT